LFVLLLKYKIKVVHSKQGITTGTGYDFNYIADVGMQLNISLRDHL